MKEHFSWNNNRWLREAGTAVGAAEGGGGGGTRGVNGSGVVKRDFLPARILIFNRPLSSFLGL